MKFLFVLVVLMLLAANVSALSSTIKPEYNRGETMLVKINGQITNSLGVGNVEFKRGTVRVPFAFDIRKIADEYYLWATASDTSGNYTLYIYNIMQSGEQQAVTFSQNFTILQTVSDYSINPGFVVTNGNFSVSIQLNTDSAMDITADFPAERTIHLTPGNNNIAFSGTGSVGMQISKIGVYDFPVYLTSGNGVISVNNTNTTTNSSGETVNNTNNNTEPVNVNVLYLEVTPTYINRLALFGGIPTYGFSVYNSGNETASNVKLMYNSDLLKITPSIPANLEANQTYYFNATFNNPINDTVRETITIESDNGNISLPISIDVTKNVTTLVNVYADPLAKNSSSNATRKTTYYCTELSGKICPSGFECSVANIDSRDGKCCLATCSEVKATNSYSWIGYLIAGIVVMVAAIVWSKYKGVKVPANPIKLPGGSP